MKKQLWQWLALGLVGLAIFSLIFTVLKPGIPSGHDIAAHMVRSKILKDALLEGQFPVRWVEWAWAGTSYPLFNFYQAAFYYMVAAVSAIVPSHVDSVKTSIVLLWWMGAGFMFLFTRRFGNLPAATASLIFAFTPYIISDVFIRASYPELGAISFSIGVLWSLDRIIRTAKPIFALPLSICLAAVITFHIPTLIIILPLILSYAFLITVTSEATKKGLILASIASILGVGLAAFYLLPAILELKYVKSDLLTSNYYDFHPHFVYPQQLFDMKWGYGISMAGDQDDMSFQFGIIQWLIILLAILSLFAGKVFASAKNFNLNIVFWLVMILYAVFFMHDISLSFWENWHFISFIQYPWRFLMVVAISCAFLSALLLSQLKNISHQAGVVILSSILIFAFYRSFLAPSVYLEKSKFDIDAVNWKDSPGVIENSFVEEGYMPREAEATPPRNIAPWEVGGVPKTPDLVIEKTIKSHYFSFVTQSQQPFILQVNSHYFPGWKAYINSQETEINYKNEFGFMLINIPPGVNKVEFKFTDTLIRSFANKISILSLLALLTWQLIGVKRLLINKTPG